MDDTFTSLLTNDSYPEYEDLTCSQVAPSSQQCMTKQKKGKRAKNFLIAEDMLLISAWLNVSLDPIQGNNQTSTSYWHRIWTYFNDNKEGLESDRTPTSLCNRWCTINSSVAKFIGYYNQICNRCQSGVTEQNKIDQALSMYETLSKDKFQFIRHWNALRHSPKYEATLEKKKKGAEREKDSSSPSSENQMPINGVNSEEGMDRPIGRKAAKKIKKNACGSTNESLNILKSIREDGIAAIEERTELAKTSLELQDEMLKIQRQKEDRERQLQEEMLKLQKLKEDREKRKEEREIMAIDTSKMLPDIAKYYDNLKVTILENM